MPASRQPLAANRSGARTRCKPISIVPTRNLSVVTVPRFGQKTVEGGAVYGTACILGDVSPLQGSTQSRA